MVELFVRDITEGCDGADYGGPLPQHTAVRAGVVKVGAGYWQISEVEHRVLEAAGEVYKYTGAPIVCHLELGTAAWEVVETLGSVGVPADRIVLAHVDRNPDPGLHAELAATGAYLGYDGAARAPFNHLCQDLSHRAFQLPWLALQEGYPRQQAYRVAARGSPRTG